MQNLKIACVGDLSVGKTCMLISYTTNAYITEYIPTVFDNYTVMVLVNGQPIKLGLWDCSGGEHYERLRPLIYPKTDVVMVCFSLVCRKSFENVLTKWVPEVRHHIPTARIVLVGTKRDLRDEGGYREDESVHHIGGSLLADEINADGYVECSSFSQEGLKEVFDTSIMCGIPSDKKNGIICNRCILS